jgi:hypothetical protein
MLGVRMMRRVGLLQLLREMLDVLRLVLGLLMEVGGLVVLGLLLLLLLMSSVVINQRWLLLLGCVLLLGEWLEW